MRDILIPLYVQPGTTGSTLAFDALGDDSRPVHTDADAATLDMLREAGQVTVWITDTPAEAKMAAEGISELAWPGVDVKAGRARDGEGLVLFNDPNNEVDEPLAEIVTIDKRRPAPQHDATEQVIGYWDRSAEGIRGISGRDISNNERLGFALSVIAAETDNTEAIKHAQIAVERIPGAYVGFGSYSVEDFGTGIGAELTEEQEALVHAAIHSSAQKYDAPVAGIEDACLGRIEETCPGLMNESRDHDVEP